MVFYLGQEPLAQGFGQPLVNLGVAGRGVIASQVHGGPVFLAGFGVEAEPSQVLGFGRQLAHALGQFGVVFGNARAQAPRAGVRQHAHVLAHGHA